MTNSPPRKKPVRQNRVSPKKSPVDYLLLITQDEDKRTKKPLTLFAVRTVLDFISFRYDLIVNWKLNGELIQFNIEGLRAPRLTMPGFGPATFEMEIDRIVGTFDVVIWKLEKEKSTFRVELRPDRVTVLSRPDHSFIEIITSKEDYS